MNDEDLRLASDPTTPAAELLRLGGLRDAALRQRLASNPNTPLPLLLELAARYPDEVLQNGAFALALLERPTLLEGLPYGTREALARSHHLGHPEAHVLYFGSFQDRSPQIPQILAANPASPPDLLERFLLDPSPLIRHAAADNPAAPALLQRLLRAGADAKLSGVLPGASADPAELEQIAALRLWGEIFAAEHPAAPPDLLRRLASCDSFHVRQALAGNPSTPPDLLAKLFERKETHGALAKNPSTPLSLLRLLAAHEETFVRVQVARNPSTDPTTMLTLLGDMTPDVRKWAASSPKIPDEWRHRLARLGLPGDLTESVLLPPEHIPREDLAPLLHGPPWFAHLVARSGSLSTHTFLHLVRTPGPHRAFQALREPLPACVYELLQRQKEGLWAEMKEQLRKRFPGHREIPAESARTALRAPSLRAPVHIGQWLVEPGEIVEAGLPVVELLCLSNDAVVRVVSPFPARVYPQCTHGQVIPGETLAGLIQVREEEARGSAASERIRGLLAQASPDDEAPAFLPVASRLEAAPVLELRVPPLGESVVEATLYRWNVKPGDWVHPESIVVSAGMDKCDADLTTPAAGIVLERLPEDTTVQIGEVYLRLQLFKVPGT